MTSNSNVNIRFHSEMFISCIFLSIPSSNASSFPFSFCSTIRIDSSHRFVHQWNVILINMPCLDFWAEILNVIFLIFCILKPKTMYLMMPSDNPDCEHEIQFYCIKNMEMYRFGLQRRLHITYNTIQPITLHAMISQHIKYAIYIWNVKLLLLWQIVEFRRLLL